SDSDIKASYVGFLSVIAVTVYELAIKDIFNEFALKKHKIFGNFVENYFKKINGRITLDDLKNQHIKRFGENYLKKFDKKLEHIEKINLKLHKISIKSMYGNLIQCRHEFVHKGNPTLTLYEVIDNYTFGKEIIHCLNDTMKR
ncbi:MAG: HEPN domain-containing protein, partial [Ignavibacterium album]